MKHTFSQVQTILEKAKDYEAFLKQAMKKFKIKDIGSLDDKETSKFFDWIDKNWDAKNEETEIDEVLSIQGRRKLGQAMKKNAKKNARKREISMKKKASPEKLKQRATKAAINKVKATLTKGKDPSSPAAKEALEKKMKKKAGLVKKLAKKLIPAMKKAEKERQSSKEK
jgi:hypothetical protein